MYIWGFPIQSQGNPELKKSYPSPGSIFINSLNGLTKLDILSNYKRPVMLCLALPARRKMQKLVFQSEFSMSKIIRIFLDFFFIEE